MVEYFTIRYGSTAVLMATGSQRAATATMAISLWASAVNAIMSAYKAEWLVILAQLSGDPGAIYAAQATQAMHVVFAAVTFTCACYQTDLLIH